MLGSLKLFSEGFNMKRVASVIFAIGLTILWIAGLSSPYSATWLTWLDGVGALIGYGIAFGTDNVANRVTRIGGPVALSIGLFALWIIGMSTNGAPWQNWWTFAFACGYLLVGLTPAPRAGVVTPVERETSDRFRRSA
jgi:hypothetical protein